MQLNLKNSGFFVVPHCARLKRTSKNNMAAGFLEEKQKELEEAQDAPPDVCVKDVVSVSVVVC